jgi:hypothetical protein
MSMIRTWHISCQQNFLFESTLDLAFPLTSFGSEGPRLLRVNFVGPANLSVLSILRPLGQSWPLPIEALAARHLFCSPFAPVVVMMNDPYRVNSDEGLGAMKKIVLFAALALVFGHMAHADECEESSRGQEDAVRTSFQNRANVDATHLAAAGCDARMILLSAQRDADAQITSTIGTTTVTTPSVFCQLYGAHAGSPMSDDPAYWCTVLPQSN